MGQKGQRGGFFGKERSELRWKILGAEFQHGVCQFIGKRGNLSAGFDPTGGRRFIQIDCDDWDALSVFGGCHLI